MVDELKLNRLKVERTQLRRVATIAFNELEVALKAKPVAEEATEIAFEKCRDKAERLFILDAQISDLFFLLPNVDSKERELDFDKIESYRERLNLTTLKNRLFPQLYSTNNGSISEGSSLFGKIKKRNIPLP